MGKSRFEIYAACLVFLLPGSVKTFVCNFHQGVEGDPRFTLIDDLSLSLLVDLERLRELWNSNAEDFRTLKLDNYDTN